jgi:hypothetical protein
MSAPQAQPKVAVQLPQDARPATGQFQSLGVDAGMPPRINVIEVRRAT